MTTVFYNPLSDNGRGEENARRLRLPQETEAQYCDITACDAAEYLKEAAPDETVILTGGDGMLNHFVNDCGGVAPLHPVYYYPTGSGNDFMRDVRERETAGVVLLNPYLKQLPTVTVDGVTRYFINGVGYGIDGYCCEEGDALRKKGSSKINYTAIAIKGLLFRFRPRTAEVTVDGVKHSYRHVWLAPAMNGRFYGGGMMVAPAQDRQSKDGTLSLVVLHCPSKLHTLAVFPSIFQGKHVEHTKMTEVLTGHDISVRFDRPTALQIDGETVRGVTSYRACSARRREQLRTGRAG